jgi:hypothetical protein
MSTSRIALASLCAATLLLTGCSDEQARLVPTFVGAHPGSGPAVYLRALPAPAASVVLGVVGRDLPSVYGLAFRLESASGALVYTGLSAGPTWSAEALVVGREPSAGLVVAGLSERADAPGFAATDTLLASLSFQVGAAVAGPVTFVDGEGAVVQADGTEASGVRWVGGVLDLR